MKYAMCPNENVRKIMGWTSCEAMRPMPDSPKWSVRYVGKDGQAGQTAERAMPAHNAYVEGMIIASYKATKNAENALYAIDNSAIISEVVRRCELKTDDRIWGSTLTPYFWQYMAPSHADAVEMCTKVDVTARDLDPNLMSSDCIADIMPTLTRIAFGGSRWTDIADLRHWLSTRGVHGTGTVQAGAVLEALLVE